VTRQYSSISVETTLASSINTTATTITVATGTATALMGGITLAPANADIFTVALDVDTVNEEIVFVTGVSGDTLTISRGQAGTGTAGVSGVAHTAGATIKHVLTSSDLIFFRNNASPVASFAFSGSTSGTTTVQASAVAGTNTLTLPATTSDTLVGKATSDTLTNKILTSPTINTATIATPTITGGTSTNSILVSPEERTTVSATAATGTINFDAVTQSVLYYTTNSSANWTLNVRGSSGVTLASMLAVGDAITVVFLATNGATAYYPTVYQIDGVAVTPKWQGGIVPSAGNASSIDAYSLTIIKTAATPTYTVLASQTKFA
jgi:hypothetical protein